jgi:hypothetical protein
MINAFRLYLARLACPETHRIIEIDNEVTDRSIIVSDLIGGGDALERGWGCDPAILFNAARYIRKREAE